ncbi:hypothetical protein [Psychrobacillus sp. BM2]|uniref:hypothetical protein n=1 Tax=Psychrobacillus sp. BM2 TaxID=3400421 RepID=UPI003B02110F
MNSILVQDKTITPKAENGVLDLRNYEFNGDNSVEMNGEVSPMLEKIHYNSKPVHRVTAEWAFCSERPCSEGALALRWIVLTSSMGRAVSGSRW